MKIPLGGSERHSHLLKRTSKIQIYFQMVEYKKQNLLKQTFKKIYSVQKGFFGVSTNIAKPFLELSQQHYHCLPSQTALDCAFYGFPSSSLPQIPTAATTAF